jgi:uncharacterized protein (TIGR01777 family)
MRIVIAGGTGFLGQALLAALGRDVHDLTILTRRHILEPAGSRSGARSVTWNPSNAGAPWTGSIDDADVVINLVGDSIAEGRWTAAKKQRILQSRVDATRALAAAISGSASPPGLFLSGSAVGFYGPRGDEIVTESDRAGDDFLASVCAQWEREAVRVASARTRVICLRTGLVLDAKAGALPKMLLPFRLGVGGRLGSGRQYMPWIHRQDWVDLVRFLVANPAASGAINATAPSPVTNAEFTKTLGRVLRRPAFLPTPAFALRLVLGEMADALLLTGQRVVPAAAQRSGYRFAYQGLESALRDLLTS